MRLSKAKYKVQLDAELFANYFRQVPRPFEVIQVDAYPSFEIIVKRQSQKTTIDNIISHITDQKFKCKVIVN